VQPPSAPPPTWWSPDDRRARSSLDRWCETVGPVVFHPVPRAQVTGPIDRLAIVTWNLHVGAADVEALLARLKSGAFTDGVPVEHFVLLLQEAYRRDEAIPVRLAHGLPVPGRIADETHRGPGVDHFWRDDGLAVLYAPSMRNGLLDVRREDRGNAIVSTIALARPALVELPLEHQRRVAVVATVSGKTRAGAAWRMRLADVHLDTALAITRGGPFAARRRQADALIAALQATAVEDEAGATTIVAGDFNTWGWREPAVDVLARAFPDAHGSGGHPTWIGPLGVRATLDRLFASGAAHVDVRRLPNRFGSDHYPLLAVVTF
jgi:endonuclease/exonuclease/phosphatase family metal-dependent hydrolase